MNTKRISSRLVHLALALFIISNVPAQAQTTIARVGKTKIPVRDVETKKATPKIVESRITTRTSLAGIDDIEELTKYYDLSRWISTEPPSSFLSCWLDQKLSRKDLSIRFAALELILTAADRQSIKIPDREKLCSAPRELIAAIQKELVEVPELSGLSRAEAENKLAEIGLVPAAKTQHDQTTEPGRVIRASQEPQAGLIVQRTDVISFKVAIHQVSLNLNDNGLVHCSRSDDGAYRFSVGGKVSELSPEKTLLLWVRPRKGPHVWYLQGPPKNGIINISSDGTWQGVGQIGNIDYPPSQGDMLDVAVTLVEGGAAKALLGQLPTLGVITETSLPGASYVVSAVRVEF